MPDFFSQRRGLAGPPAGTLFREEMPTSFRRFLTELPHNSSIGLEFHEMRDVVCDVLQVWPKQHEVPYVDYKPHLQQCEWFRIYDIIEGIYKLLEEKQSQSFNRYANTFVGVINQALVDQNLGWQLDYSGEVIARGDETFEHTVKLAVQELEGRQTTRKRIQEAINDLSRRPEPDLSGAISHAFAAMECIIGDIKYTPDEIRDTNHTFGVYLRRHPDLFRSEDLKGGFQQLWRFANNEGSRHGKEGIEPAREEAELIVSLAATLITYLNRRHPK
jgi:hypothetical protein